jgi:hypothetical protein
MMLIIARVMPKAVLNDLRSLLTEHYKKRDDVGPLNTPDHQPSV